VTNNALEPWSGDQPRPAYLGKRTRRVLDQANAEQVSVQARAALGATRIRGAVYLGDELMTALDRLRRHEARAAAEDPVVADEYAAVRKAVFFAGLDEIERYGRRP
jgi:hypothetical protein